MIFACAKAGGEASTPTILEYDISSHYQVTGRIISESGSTLREGTREGSDQSGGMWNEKGYPTNEKSHRDI